jgi:hypothetical protein
MPYTQSKSLTNGVYVTVMYKRPYRDDYTPLPLTPEGFRPGDDAPAFVGLLTDTLPAAIPRLTQATPHACDACMPSV